MENFMDQLSRYMPEIIEFARKAHAKAVYCFALDGDRGTGGCPLVMGTPPPDEYRERCKELVAMLRRSADLLEQDIERQVGLSPGRKGN